MSDFERNLIKFGLGLFLLIIVVFKHSFFYLNMTLVYAFIAIVGLSSSLIFYSLACLIGLKGWFGIIFLVIIEVALSFISSLSLIGRIPSRVYDFVKNIYDFGYMNIAQYDETISQYVPDLIYKLKPGTSEFDNWEYSSTLNINQFGLRSSEEVMKAPKVIFLGDSFTMGWGVQNQETFPEVFSKMSGEECLNAGISSYGTAREYLLLKQLPKDSCRVLFIQYCYNDLLENYLFSRNGEELMDKQILKADYFKNVRINYLVKHYYPGKNLYWFIRQACSGIQLPLPGNEKKAGSKEKIPDDHGPLFIGVLKAIRSIYKGQIVVYYMGRPVDPTISDQLANAISQHPELNVQWLDMRDTGLSAKDYFFWDMHLNQRGTQKVAQRLWRYTSEKQLLKPSEN